MTEYAYAGAAQMAPNASWKQDGDIARERPSVQRTVDLAHVQAEKVAALVAQLEDRLTGVLLPAGLEPVDVEVVAMKMDAEAYHADGPPSPLRDEAARVHVVLKQVQRRVETLMSRLDV